jgi:hypothetical protein
VERQTVLTAQPNAVRLLSGTTFTLKPNGISRTPTFYTNSLSRASSEKTPEHVLTGITTSEIEMCPVQFRLVPIKKPHAHCPVSVIENAELGN